MTYPINSKSDETENLLNSEENGIKHQMFTRQHSMITRKRSINKNNSTTIVSKRRR
jgi:hypothetical protein